MEADHGIRSGLTRGGRLRPASRVSDAVAPVFLDESGTRHARMRAAVVLASGVCAAFLALATLGITGSGPLSGTVVLGPVRGVLDDLGITHARPALPDAAAGPELAGSTAGRPVLASSSDAAGGPTASAPGPAGASLAQVAAPAGASGRPSSGPAPSTTPTTQPTPGPTTTGTPPAGIRSPTTATPGTPTPSAKGVGARPTTPGSSHRATPTPHPKGSPPTGPPHPSSSTVPG